MSPAFIDLLLTGPVAVPAAAAAAAAVPGRRGLPGWVHLASPAAILGAAAAMAAALPGRGALRAFGHLLRADAVSVWLLLVIGAVAALALAASPAYLAGERGSGRAGAPAVRRYYTLVHAFLGAMSAAVLAENLGLVWVALEATTVLTAFLVGHRRTRASVEAAWKYMVICSTGIALAFLGTVLVYYAARQAGLSASAALDWPVLAAHAGSLDPGVTRLGIALVVLGFGAKAGLAPLHAWLPDAHSQAPAPVSALMSGALLPTAFSAVLRYKAVADAALGTGFLRVLLLCAALPALALAAVLLLGQRDYKRMLAYSSMEHMSLIAVGTAVGGPAAIAAVLLHMAGHGLAKSAAFCSAGHVLQLHGTSRISRVRGLLAGAPALGAVFGLAVLALLGLPPFSLFASELGMVRAGFAAGLGTPVATALLLVLVAFGAMALHTGRMVLGTAPSGAEGGAASGAPVRIGASAAAAPTAGLLLAAALGVTTGPLTGLLQNAAAVVGGH